MTLTLFFLLLPLLPLSYLFYASYSIQSGVYVKTFCRRKTTERTVVLTFDDGPDSIQTPLILDLLKQRKATATFFCIGQKVAGNEAIIRRMVDEGHTIGNHAYSHHWHFPLLKTSGMTADLKRCESLLENTINREVKWFRPPFGVTNPTLAKAVSTLNYQTIGWNIRTFDTQNISPERIVRRVRKKLKPGSILLLHDRMPNSEVLLEKILNLLEAEDYKVVSLKEWL